MDFLDDNVFGPMNLIDRLQGLIMGAIYQDMGHKFTVRYHDRGGKHTRAEIESLLNKYGIAVYGRTHDANNMHFLVKKRQARWAEHVMRRAGVELIGGLVDASNAKVQVGTLPKAWAERPASGWRRKTKGDSLWTW